MKRKIIDDISIGEMRTLRERGMNNRDIAESLGISYNSVIRHIGKQPSEMRAAPTHMEKPTSVKVETEKPIPVAFRLLDVCKQAASGVQFEGMLDLEKQEVMLRIHDDSILVSRDDLSELSAFLFHIGQCFSRFPATCK